MKYLISRREILTVSKNNIPKNASYRVTEMKLNHKRIALSRFSFLVRLSGFSAEARRLIVPEGRMRVARHEVPGMASKEAIRPRGTG
jgi:hypothetical protein